MPSTPITWGSNKKAGNRNTTPRIKANTVAAGFIFFILNLVAIGFLQSVKRVIAATVFALMRGVVFLFPAFLLLPELIGVKGMWLALPLSELLTFIVVVGYMFFKRSR